MKCEHCKKTIWMWQYNAMIISQPYKSGFVPFNLKPGEYHKDCSIKATELFHNKADQYIKDNGYNFHCSVTGIYPVHKIVSKELELKAALDKKASDNMHEAAKQLYMARDKHQAACKGLLS